VIDITNMAMSDKCNYVNLDNTMPESAMPGDHSQTAQVISNQASLNLFLAGFLFGSDMVEVDGGGGDTPGACMGPIDTIDTLYRPPQTKRDFNNLDLLSYFTYVGKRDDRLNAGRMPLGQCTRTDCGNQAARPAEPVFLSRRESEPTEC
jgi:hypothetical protein